LLELLLALVLVLLSLLVLVLALALVLVLVLVLLVLLLLPLSDRAGGAAAGSICSVMPGTMSAPAAAILYTPAKTLL
jgi:hypothetical protein